MIEARVTEYMHSNFTFSVIEVANKEERLEFELKLISSISCCDECLPSPKWLGRSSPKEKITQSGLWLVNQLYKTQFNIKEIHYLESLINKQLSANGVLVN